IRAAIRAAYPQEKPIVWKRDRVKLRNFLWTYVPKLQIAINRITPYAAVLGKGTQMMRQLYYWENWVHSTLFLMALSFAILFVEPYMIGLGLFVGMICLPLMSLRMFRKNSSRMNRCENDASDSELASVNLEDYMDARTDSDSSDPENKKKKEKKKTLKKKLKKAREVMGTLLVVTEEIASVLEKFESVLRWQVPWLSWLMLLFILVIIVITYFIPLRYILLIYVIKRFTRKLRKAQTGDASPLSIVLRVPDKVEQKKYRLFRMHPLPVDQ
ncbi:hypothetical protein P879_08856, partial [Paragonimus westermani]